MVQPACSHAKGIKTKHKMIKFIKFLLHYSPENADTSKITVYETHCFKINDAREKAQKEITVSIRKAPVLQQNPLPPFH